MSLVQASDAARLSGLTPHQLREWCGRRTVVTADVPPAGRGHLALFSWQTILALRVLNEVHQRYSVEVSGWRLAIAQLQAILKGRSFPSLWGAVAVFPNAQEALLKLDGEVYAKDACLSVGLSRHLVLLRHERRMCEASSDGARQHGHRLSVLARATVSFRRMVAIEFVTCRSGRSGGRVGSSTRGNDSLLEFAGCAPS